eukprot:9498979-Pyramimonas_sp.AAC.1
MNSDAMRNLASTSKLSRLRVWPASLFVAVPCKITRPRRARKLSSGAISLSSSVPLHLAKLSTPERIAFM